MTVDTKGLGSGFASLATQNGLTCVSRDGAGVAEHIYSGDPHGHYESFASFAPTSAYPQGVVAYYNSATGQLTITLAPWVAMALWNRSEAFRAQLVTEQAQNAALTAQLATAKAAPTATPATAADTKKAEAARALLAAWAAFQAA